MEKFAALDKQRKIHRSRRGKREKWHSKQMEGRRGKVRKRHLGKEKEKEEKEKEGKERSLSHDPSSFAIKKILS